MKIINKKGQGLIELIIAIAVITTGLFAVWTLFLSNFNGEQEAKARVIGANLAREGIEAVKNIRDSNWLYVDENQKDGANFWTWDRNLDAGTFYYLKNINGTDLGANDPGLMILSSSTNSAEDRKLYINTNINPLNKKYGMFEHVSTTGKFSGYSRVISIKNICCQINTEDPSSGPMQRCINQAFTIQLEACASPNIKIGIDVKSQVEWIIKDKNRKVIIEDQLFNWR